LDPIYQYATETLRSIFSAMVWTGKGRVVNFHVIADESCYERIQKQVRVGSACTEAGESGFRIYPLDPTTMPTIIYPLDPTHQAMRHSLPNAAAQLTLHRLGDLQEAAR
jgi:hypothetical protein